MAKDTPLNNTDLNNINDALRRLNEFAMHVNNAKQAGLDTDAFERQAAYYEQRLNQLKSIYFPGKP